MELGERNMSEYEFDLSMVNEITVEAQNGDEAIEALLGTIERRVKNGSIQAREVKAFDVKSQGTGCRYVVEAHSQNEAETILRTYLENQRKEALDEIQPHQAGYDLLVDFNVACKTEGESTSPVEINREGRRVD